LVLQDVPRRIDRAAAVRRQLIPRRWAVVPTFARLTAHRRLARDYELNPAMPETTVRWAAINTITPRIARGGPAIRQQRRTTVN